jgi:hypothetical protein
MGTNEEAKKIFQRNVSIGANPGKWPRLALSCFANMLKDASGVPCLCSATSTSLSRPPVGIRIRLHDGGLLQRQSSAHVANSGDPDCVSHPTQGNVYAGAPSDATSVFDRVMEHPSQRSTWPNSRLRFRRLKVETTQEHDLDRRNTMEGAGRFARF